jgi:hypothetical protein
MPGAHALAPLPLTDLDLTVEVAKLHERELIEEAVAAEKS